MIIVKTELISGGLFAQIINRIFEILLTLKKYNVYPQFIIHSRLYGIGPEKQIIPHYLLHNYEYNSNNNKSYDNIITKTFPFTIENDNYVFSLMDIHKKWKSVPKTRDESNALFFEYFDFPDKIKCEVNFLHNKYFLGKRILGFHYRGTDKMGSENNKAYSESLYVDFKNTLDILREKINEEKYKSLFVATDDKTIIHTLQDEFPDVNLITIHPDYKHSNGIPIHTNTLIKTDQDRYEMGKSAIIDTMLLSKCDILIKYASQMSAYAVICNPSLKAYRINNTNYNWFPEYFVQQLMKL